MIPYNARNQRIEAWVNAATEESEDAAPTDPEARDLHDQEKAQRIEHEDLCRENKQVGPASSAQPSCRQSMGCLLVASSSAVLF